jgi:hypothetical protein
MISGENSETFYVGNASTVTAYAVELDFASSDDVKAHRLDAGTGTVTIVSGVATFSSAQSTLIVGSHLRIAGTTYTIATRTSSTVFGITDHTVDVASSSFHLPDDAVLLVSGSTYTITGTSGDAEITTDPAIAATALLRIYRDTPITQETSFPSSGPFNPSVMEDALDKLTMIAQELTTTVQNAGIVVPEEAGTGSTTDTTTFANAAARAAATPTRIGQQGVQLDTRVEYYGTATTAGSWAEISENPAVRVFTTYALLGAATPHYLGQIAMSYEGPGPSQGEYFYRGTSLVAGGWTVFYPSLSHIVWSALGWTADEELIPGQRRWVGMIPNQLFTHQLDVSTAKPGAGTLTFRVYYSSGLAAPTLVTTEDLEIEPESRIVQAARTGYTNFDLITGIQGETATSYIPDESHIEVEIVSIGESTTQETTGGSPIVTIPNVDTLNISTGTRINVLSHGEVVVLATRGDGATVLSHAATATDAAEEITYGGRSFVRGVLGLSAVAGARTVTVAATDAELVDAGDVVIGDTVLPGTTVIANNGTTTLTLSHPLLGDTATLGFLNTARAPVTHHVVISEPDGEDEIALGSVRHLLVGDTAIGTWIPATSRITAIDTGANVVTIDPPINGGAITEITFTYPRRSVTGTAGATTFTVDNATGALNGTRVEGPGIPTDTFVTGTAGVTISISKALALSLTTENVQFTRDTMQITSSITSASEIVTIPFAVTTTPLEVGMEVTGTGIASGTFIESLAGAQVTMTRNATATNAAVALRFSRTPIWKGLHLNFSGAQANPSL